MKTTVTKVKNVFNGLYTQHKERINELEDGSQKLSKQKCEEKKIIIKKECPETMGKYQNM